MIDLYTRAGKQVLRNGCHFVDACDEEAAEIIVRAFALPDKFAAYLDAEAEKSPRARVRARTLRVMADNVRAGLWSKDDDQGGEG